MKACKLVALSAAFLFVLTFEPASAADDAKPEQKKGAKGQFQKGQFQAQNFQLPGRPGGGSLLSAEALEKLKLSAEQKEKYTKFDEEYKAKANGEKMREALKGADKDKIAEAFQNSRTESQKLREDYLAKVEGLLSADQKKTFEEVKAQRPGFGGFGGRGGAGQVLSSGVQDRLKLSEEQKKKVEDLQKEIDSKINSILTEEQRKQFDEIKKGGGQPPRRPNTGT